MRGFAELERLLRNPMTQANLPANRLSMVEFHSAIHRKKQKSVREKKI